MDASSNLKTTLREAIEAGLEDEDKDIVAKFTGHAIAYLRMFPPDEETGETLFKGPAKGVLSRMSQPGQA